jgi:glycosyltransferase 2 family protein
VATEVSSKTRQKQARLAVREASERGGLERHPGDFVRAFLASVSLVITCLIARGGRVGAYEHEVFHLINRLPSPFTTPLVIIQQAGTLAAVGVAGLLALAMRRTRLALDLAIGGGAAYILARGLKLLVARQRPAGVFENVVIRGAEQAGLGFPSGHVAVAAALVTVAAPYFPRSLQRALWGLVALIAVARMYVGAHLPIDVIGGAALGWLIGATVHLLRGAPGNRPTVQGVRAALGAAGVHAVAVKPLSADARGSTPFIADLEDGSRAFVKVVSREQRDADLLFKLYRLCVPPRRTGWWPRATDGGGCRYR